MSNRTITVTDGNGVLASGSVIYILDRKDSRNQANSIRANFKKIGSGICAGKKKVIDIYMDTARRLWGISTIKPNRIFRLGGRK